MKNRYSFFLLLFLIVATLTGCQEKRGLLYQSDRFKILNDRVAQGKYTARVVSDTEITSDYQSNSYFSSIIQFKFSINGKDNELGYNINHDANIFTQNDQPVVIDVVFGKRMELLKGKEREQNLPQNTKVKFRLDFSRVLKSFKEKGFYEDVHGERIYKQDFKGVFIAGSSFPLNWDFENLTNNEKMQLKDTDGDGIYETELVFNAFDPAAHVSSQWKLKNDISKYPVFKSESPLLNAIYNMSLDELRMDIEADSTFRTGVKWAGVWTRDVSYSITLALAFLEPEIAKISLMRKVKDNHIIQDTGTGGAWPVSSDRVVWAMAAWEIYTYTGDRKWLESAYQIILNSVNADARTIHDRQTGLMRGESSFLDWRKQTYPLWMEPADIYASLNLGTNAAHFRVLTILGKMAGELGKADPWTTQAKTLKENINKYLWLPEKQYYGQYLYGRNYKTLSPRSEALGEAFCVLFDIAAPEQKDAVMDHTPLLGFGIPCIYPQIPNMSPYHNNAVWPFVQSFWTLAAAKEKHAEMVNYGLASMLRQSALFLTNKENFVAGDGDFAGTVINSDRQLWSIAGQLAMNYRVLLGMEFEPGRLAFHPLIPENFKGTYTLDNLHYRGGFYTITVKGFGDEIASFKIDGEEDGKHAVLASQTGNHTIVIKMNSQVRSKPVRIIENYTAPETPVLSREKNVLNWTSVEKASGYELYRNGEKWQTVSATNIKLGEPTSFSEYQVLAVDSQGVQSFKSNPVQVLSESGQTVLQAESFNLKGEHAVEGFSGKGYVVFSKENGAELHFSISVPEAGTYGIQFRYANGSGPVNTDNKCGVRSLYINNTFVCSLIFAQRGKDEWSNWGFTNPEYIELIKGENTFAVTFDHSNENMNGGINSFFLDQIIIFTLNK